MATTRTEPAEATSRRLLASSSKSSYDPAVDIDWDAPVDGAAAFMPMERVSVYGTHLWDSLSEAQRKELSKHELASIASTGLWFELILMQMLVREAFRRDPQDPRTQYALTEVGDETRHVVMFARTIRTLGVPTYRPPAWLDLLVRVYKALARGPSLYAPVLVAEETLDRFQRETMNDEAVHPLVRMVNRIHVVEEARHVRFAREEIVRTMPTLGPVARAFHQLLTALVAAAVVNVFVNPRVYAAVGVRPRDGWRAARENPHHHASTQWMGEKVMAFLQEQGLVPWFTRPIYRWAHLL